MRGPFCILLITLVALCPDQTRAATDKIVCYFATWASARMSIENINPTACSHLIYAFAGINPDGTVRIIDSQFDITNNGYNRFTSLKNKNPALKTMIAIGGWNEGSTKFSQVASSPSLRNTFVANVVQFLKKYNFDGVDIDWEYPAQNGGVPSDVNNFNILLSQLKASCAQNNLLVSVAVSPSEWGANQSYKISEMNKYVDLINLMTYDFYGSWKSTTAFNAGLGDDKLCVDYWINNGADPAKIMLGLPFYGYGATLTSSQNGIGAPATCNGPLDYGQIAQKLNSGGWTVIMDQTQQTPYAYKGSQWMTFDNAQSITAKVNYAKSRGIGGVMIWSIDQDDISGASGAKMQLMNTVNSLIKGSNNGPVPPVPPPTTTTTTTPASSNGGDMSYLCKNQGYVRDPNNCSVFYYCVYNINKYIAYKFTCPTNLVFDPTISTCNWPYNVQC